MRNSDVQAYLGLSPRARGSHCNLMRTLLWGRSIPACAGEPSGHSIGRP